MTITGKIILRCVICNLSVEKPEIYTICNSCKRVFGICFGVQDLPRLRKEVKEKHIK